MARKDHFVSGQVGPNESSDAPIWNYPNTEILSEDKREVVIPVMMEPAEGKKPAKWTSRTKMEQDKPMERVSAIGGKGNVRIMMRHPQSHKMVLGAHHLMEPSLPDTASLEFDSPEAKALRVSGQEAKENFREEFAPLQMARRARAAKGPRKKEPLNTAKTKYVSGTKPEDKPSTKKTAEKKPSKKKK